MTETTVGIALNTKTETDNQFIEGSIKENEKIKSIRN